MSPYERRRRGNALRGGERRHPGVGNTGRGQRGSGHLAAPGRSPDTEPGGTRSSTEIRRYEGRACERTVGGRGVCESALEPHGWREGSQGKAGVRTGLGKTDRPGSQGGLGRRDHGGAGNPPRNRKSETGNPPPTVRALQIYPDCFQQYTIARLAPTAPSSGTPICGAAGNASLQSRGEQPGGEGELAGPAIRPRRGAGGNRRRRGRADRLAADRPRRAPDPERLGDEGGARRWSATSSRCCPH
jgi:hypothetical protein